MRYLSVMLCFLSYYGYSQVINPNQKKWQIGISYEANISWRMLRYNTSNEWVADIRNDSEIPKFGYLTGLNFRYNINKKFSLETALLFANRGYSTKKESLNWVIPDPNLPLESKTILAYYYIEIPLKVNYNFNIGKVKLYSTGGFSLNNFINKQTTLITYKSDGTKEKSKSQENYGYKQNTYSILLGFGMDIPIAKAILLNIEPMYRQNISSIVVDNDAKEYLYSFGVNVRAFLNLRNKKKSTKS